MSKAEESKVYLALSAIEDKKGEDAVALDLREISSVTDYFVVATGNSDTQVRAIADGVRDRLAEKGIVPLGVEGYNNGTWVLLDFADLVVHVFHREARAFYDLERLWEDAPRVRPEEERKAGTSSRRQRRP